MKLWKGMTAALAVLFIGFNLIYRLGSDGVSVRGTAVSFSRLHDKQLYRVDANNAVLLQSADTTSTEQMVVRIKAAPFPFSLLCGGYLSDGFTTDYETIVKDNAILGRNISKKPHPTPGERDRVLVAMTPAEVHTQLKPVSTCNESCVTFNAAFLFLFALAFIALPVLLLLRRRNA